MFSFERLMAATKARSLEFVRDRSSLGWNLLFPLLMVLGFAAIFSGPGKPLFKVALLGDGVPAVSAHPFLTSEHIQFYAESDLDLALRKVSRHRIDLLIDLQSSPTRYWVNPESGKSVTAETLLRASGGVMPVQQEVEGKSIRYIDWAMPGILGVNLMFSALFGVGFVIVRYRKSGHLKRLSATPLTALEFVSAQILSRLAVVMITTTMMFIGCDWIIGFAMEGSYLDLFILTLVGTLTLASMGLLVAARISSEEVSGGLLNMISTPMMILSGAFFSLDGSPEWVLLLAEFMPLTHMLTAARSIMLDGTPLTDLMPQLGLLLAMTGVLLAVGAGLFKWSQD